MLDIPILAIPNFFDFKAHPFQHQNLLTEAKNVITVLNQIGPYCDQWLKDLPKESQPQDSSIYLDSFKQPYTYWHEEGAIFKPDHIIGSENRHQIYLARNAKIIGGTIDLSSGSLYIGEESTISGAWICGPTIIGKKTTVRPGAYLRGNVILGNQVVVRGEIKNSILMDKCDFVHPSYLGDSICGYKTHFGNQATAANLSIFGSPDSLKISINGQKVDLGRRKIGIIMGDFSQLGCNAVSDPATFLLPHTLVYPLTRLNNGIYGPNEIIKNKPMAHGIIERSPLK